MDKTNSKPVSDEELEEESEIEEVIEKDGSGYGDLQSLNAQPDDTNRDEETYVGRRAPKESETYIQERKSYNMGMTDQNKLKNTKIGDHINYYDNGISGNGIVTKMSGQFIQIFKDDGQFYNLNINDTFHVSDILINKTWDDMDLAERTDELIKIKAYSPRFLNKNWDQLPRELKDVMKKDDWDKNERDNERRSGRGGRGGSGDGDKSGDHSHSFKDIQEMLHHQGSSRGEAGQGYETENIDPKKQTFDADDEEYKNIYERQSNSMLKSRISKAEWDSMKSSSEDGAFGNTGSSPTTGVSTKIPFDATEDYEGTTHDTRPKQFEYEDEKPEVGKEPKPEEVKLDEQGLIKTQGFVYSDNPQGYKLPAKELGKGYGIKYGVKYINEEEDN